MLRVLQDSKREYHIRTSCVIYINFLTSLRLNTSNWNKDHRFAIISVLYSCPENRNKQCGDSSYGCRVFHTCYSYFFNLLTTWYCLSCSGPFQFSWVVTQTNIHGRPQCRAGPGLLWREAEQTQHAVHYAYVLKGTLAAAEKLTPYSTRFLRHSIKKSPILYRSRRVINVLTIPSDLLNIYIYTLIQGVLFIVSPSEAASSRGRPSAGTSRQSFRVGGHHQRDTMYNLALECNLHIIKSVCVDRK